MVVAVPPCSKKKKRQNIGPRSDRRGALLPLFSPSHRIHISQLTRPNPPTHKTLYDKEQIISNESALEREGMAVRGWKSEIGAD